MVGFCGEAKGNVQQKPAFVSLGLKKTQKLHRLIGINTQGVLRTYVLERSNTQED